MKRLFGGRYQGKKILVTGHTGFKGSWLTLWLKHLGADIRGYALSPPTTPNHFDLSGIDLDFSPCDIRDSGRLERVFSAFQPELVFHLAAQPLVRYAYLHPADTFVTNIMGTVNVLEACRRTPSVRAVINITSDKCYENPETLSGCREIDPLGGCDPYSASKACAELVSAAYRRSFFESDPPGEAHRILLATARAGNVIGGGDWQADRLVPDIVRALWEKSPLLIRHPNAVRPWQHVLDCLSGYLRIGQRLIEGRQDLTGAWNFGPNAEQSLTVMEIVGFFQQERHSLHDRVLPSEGQPFESQGLRIDSSKARRLIDWQPVWSLEKALDVTKAWYRRYYEAGIVSSEADLISYVRDAETAKAVWATGEAWKENR